MQIRTLLRTAGYLALSGGGLVLPGLAHAKDFKLKDIDPARHCYKTLTAEIKITDKATGKVEYQTEVLGHTINNDATKKHLGHYDGSERSLTNKGVPQCNPTRADLNPQSMPTKQFIEMRMAQGAYKSHKA